MLGFVRHETVILKVVAWLMNPTLGCKELKKCSETCLVFSVILFIQLCNCLDMYHLLNTVNLATDASTWLKNKSFVKLSSSQCKQTLIETHTY